MNIHILKIIIMTLILVAAVYTDVKSKTIPDKLNLIALSLGLIIWCFSNRKMYYMVSFIMAFIIFMFIVYITDGGIGGGDIKLISILGLYLGYYDWLIFCFVTFLCASITSIIRRVLKTEKDKGIIFAPYILIGYIAISLINYFNLGGHIW